MKLWSDEIEAMRPEARAVVAAGMEVVAAMFAGQGEPPTDLEGLVAFQRAGFATTYAPVAEAVVTEFAGVPCRLFEPDGPARSIYVHFHGGGMVIGAPEMNDGANLALARSHGVVVISVKYRLAPEHPFPAGPDDGMAVLRWILDHGADRFGTDRVILGGESAGGYMAAAVLLRARDELEAFDRIVGANLVFGVMDWGHSPSQRGLRAVDGPDMLTPAGMALFGDCYLPGRSADERRDGSISPAFADLHGLPPALVSVGTADHLLDDSLLFASRFAAAENDLELFVAPDMPHGFQAFPCGITSAWERTMNDWFTARLG
jgi:acetyl esterase/lipase